MNNEPPSAAPTKGWNGGMIILVVLLVMIGIGMSVPLFNVKAEPARAMQAASNARQIIIALKNYAGDHGGHYPDAVLGVTTSNDAFRECFKRGLLEDERIFTSVFSPFEGDNEIGNEPECADALKPRENHWSLVAGQTDNSPGDRALVFENSVNFELWPPR